MITVSVASNAADVVSMVGASEMEWSEGRQAIEVELRASGYDVVEESSEAVEPGPLLEQLQVTRPQKVVATVTVVKMGRSGIAYVWLAETGQMYRVTSSESDSQQGANVLSLRVVELISLRGSGFEVERTARPEQPKHEPAPATGTPAPKDRHAPHWVVLAGGGMKFGSDLSRPLSNLYLGLQRDFAPAFSIEVAGWFSAVAARQRFDQGSIEVAEQGALVGALVQAKLGEHLEARGGPTIGYRCFDLRAAPTSDASEVTRRACSAVSGILSRVSIRRNALSLWLSGSAALGLAPVRLLDGDRVFATLGRPEAGVLMGAGWQF